MKVVGVSNGTHVLEYNRRKSSNGQTLKLAFQSQFSALAEIPRPARDFGPRWLWPDCDSGWQGSSRRMEWMPMFRGFEAFKFGFSPQISFSTFRFLNYSEGGFANPSGRSLKHPKTLLESLVRLEKRCPYLRDCICIRPIPGPRPASVFTPELCD